jgi:ElaA protein
MLSWQLTQFPQLTPYEVYSILQLRSSVFVVEQQCIFQDMDNKDQQCHHLMGWLEPAKEERVLLAYARLVPPGIAYEYPSIGRVATAPSVRQYGYGKLLMEKSIEALAGLYGHTPIRIGAQQYLNRFYESFGFKQSGDVYDEDGIPHIEMTRE